MRSAVVVMLAAAIGLGCVLAGADGAQRSATARAHALVAAGTTGLYGEVGARGADGQQRHSGVVDVRGLRIGSAESGAISTIAGGAPSARSWAVARSVDILDGLVTAYGVRRGADDDTGRPAAAGRVQGLRIDGRMIGDVEDARSFDLPDGTGRLFVNRDGIGLRVVLERPARGFAPGTDIRVAIASATARPARASTPAATPEPTSTPGHKPRRKSAADKLKRRAAPAVERRLTAGGFAFPVYGEADVADDFGGPREIGPHQGNDVFAAFGSPVVAVTDGTVSKVGTLPIAGNRLWVTSPGGDAFFYAHLSAFSPAAVEGATVKAGTVLGFVGNTGDAEPTPPHVHFEVHPGGETNDAVDPHPILLAWQGRRDVAPGAWLQHAGGDTAERPGALVSVRDFIAE